jgi:hypothetical protein
MDRNRLARLARMRVQAAPRRTMLGLGVAGLLGALGLDAAAAKRKKRKGKKHQKTCKKCGSCQACQKGKCKPAAAGTSCGAGAECLANGTCATICPALTPCPGNCSCAVPNVEGQRHCGLFYTPCEGLPACTSTAQCPAGHECVATLCDGLPKLCVPLCSA